MPGPWRLLPPHSPFRTCQPPLGHDSPSPQAAVARALESSASPQALQDPPTPWVGLPVPSGWCARALETAASPQALQNAPTTLWARLPVPPEWCARALETDASLQVLRDAPTTPWAGLPVSPGRCARALETIASPQALRDAPTTPLAGLPVHRGSCDRALEAAASLQALQSAPTAPRAIIPFPPDRDALAMWGCCPSPATPNHRPPTRKQQTPGSVPLKRGACIHQERPAPGHPHGRTGPDAARKGRTGDGGPHGARFGPT